MHKGLSLCIGLLLAGAGSLAAQEPDGKATYEKYCQKCHGANGTPPATILKMNPQMPTLDAKFMAGRSVDSVVAVLMNGIGKKRSMKDKLTQEEMTAAAKYVQTLVKTATE